MAGAGTLPDPIVSKLVFLLRMFANHWVISSFLAAFLAALCWMVALTKFNLNHAYPFMGLTFVLVLLLSNFLFSEPITLLKAVGVTLIIIGIAIGSQG